MQVRRKKNKYEKSTSRAADAASGAASERERERDLVSERDREGDFVHLFSADFCKYTSILLPSIFWETSNVHF
jgi:hypothetical protein